MLNRLRREERGAITAVWAAVLGAVVLLGVTFVEREWVNYKLKLAEQTADFAAEAGSRRHEVRAAVVAEMEQYYYVDVLECVEEEADGTCIKKDWVQKRRIRYDTRSLDEPRRDLEGRKWQTLAGCGYDPWEPHWRCTSVRLERQYIEFLSDADDVAITTFWDNWTDHHAADVLDVKAYPYAGDQSVRVVVQLRLRPLFGLLPYTFTEQIVARSVVKLSPMDVSL